MVAGMVMALDLVCNFLGQKGCCKLMWGETSGFDKVGKVGES